MSLEIRLRAITLLSKSSMPLGTRMSILLSLSLISPVSSELCSLTSNSYLSLPRMVTSRLMAYLEMWYFSSSCGCSLHTFFSQSVAVAMCLSICPLEKTGMRSNTVSLPTAIRILDLRSTWMRRGTLYCSTVT